MARPQIEPTSPARTKLKSTLRTTLRCLEPVAIFGITLLLNLAGNDRTGLWDRDEPRYAVCVREMRESGDWIFPTFNGEPRYHKPVLIYWLMGIATKIAGDNPFGVRLVSGIAGSLTVLGVWWFGRRILGPAGGRLAAIMLATAPIMVAESKLATTDATLCLFILACQACLWSLSKQPSTLIAATFWTLLALATLTKGPVGPALIAVSSVLAWLCGWRGPIVRNLDWKRGAVIFSLITVPWLLAITIASGGDFLRYAVGKEILHRMANDMEKHGGFPGYYPVISLVAFYPWSALFPVALLAAWMRRERRPVLAFLIGWSVGPLLLLECFHTKLIHYYLPAFPAWALLLAWLVLSISAQEINIRRLPLGRLAMALLASIGLAGSTIMLAGLFVLPTPLHWPLFIMATLLAIGTLGGMLSLQRAATQRGVSMLAATWFSILLLAGSWLIPNSEPYRTSRVIGSRLATLSKTLGIEPVMLEYQEPGVVYALGHGIATTRNRDDFYAYLGDRSILTVILPSEAEVMREKFGLSVRVVDEVDGFMLAKGKQHTFQLAVITCGEESQAPVEPLPPTDEEDPATAPPAPTPPSPSPSLARSQQPLIK